MTAGFPRKPGMSRTDLLKANADIVRPAAEAVKKHAPDAYVVVVTNPLDVMAHLFWKVTGFPPSARPGHGRHPRLGALPRLPRDGAGRLGRRRPGHGARRPRRLDGAGRRATPRSAGIPITELMPADRIAAIAQRTRDGGAEIVKLLKTGSAYYAPAMSAVEMIEAILTDQKRLVPCSVLLEGEYGLKDLFIGVPVMLGGKGVEKILELELAPEDLKALQKSGKDVVRRDRRAQRRSVTTPNRRAVLGVIPARYGASRFPGKPLAPLWGSR